MLDSPRARFGSLVVLLAVLFAMMVWYGTLGPVPALGSYPSAEYHGPSPEQYVGDRVVTAGVVVSTDPVHIAVTYGTGRAEYRVTGLDRAVERGKLLRVFGRLTAPRTIEAENAFTVPQSGLWYTWSVSFLAGLWVLARIVRHWRFDAGPAALVPRERSLAVRNLVGIGRTGDRESAGHAPGGGDGDA